MRRLASDRLFLFVVLVLVAGVAYATIPDASGVIHACYSKSGGSLRVIDASVTTCKSGETSLSWSVQGIPGPQGPQGPAGPQGPQGEPGSSIGSVSKVVVLNDDAGGHAAGAQQGR